MVLEPEGMFAACDLCISSLVTGTGAVSFIAFYCPSRCPKMEALVQFIAVAYHKNFWKPHEYGSHGVQLGTRELVAMAFPASSHHSRSELRYGHFWGLPESGLAPRGVEPVLRPMLSFSTAATYFRVSEQAMHLCIRLGLSGCDPLQSRS